MFLHGDGGAKPRAIESEVFPDCHLGVRKVRVRSALREKPQSGTAPDDPKKVDAGTNVHPLSVIQMERFVHTRPLSGG